MKKLITTSFWAFAICFFPALCSAQLIVNDSVLANVSCNGYSTGSAWAIVSGGTTPYTYSWAPSGGNDSIATGLSAGTYTVTVFDLVGDSTVGFITITQPNPLSAMARGIITPTCSNSDNGSAMATPLGGTAPYTYLWNDANSQTTATATGLSAGEYLVTVSDSCGASITDSVTVRGPRPVTIIARRIIRISCFGGDNASASANPRHGSLPYTYSWSPSGETTDTATGLSAGSYTVTVTDSCGSSVTGAVTITQPTQLTTTAYAAPDSGGCTGMAWTANTGGTPPYAYSWANGQTTDTISMQCSATYCCLITDANGCTDSVCVSVMYSSIQNISAAASQLTVYPNPSSGKYTLQMGNGVSIADDDLQVYNSLGENVYPPYQMGSQFMVDLTAQPAGVYFLRIISKKGYLVGEAKLVIQK